MNTNILYNNDIIYEENETIDINLDEDVDENIAENIAEDLDIGIDINLDEDQEQDIYINQNEDDEIIDFKGLSCKCDKTNYFHYAIVNQILGLQEYIGFGKYSCYYCYNKIENNDFIDIDLNNIKLNVKNNILNILDTKNKYGHTPEFLISKFLKIIKNEYNHPYIKFRTYRQLRCSEYSLNEITAFIKEEKNNIAIKNTTLCCASKFEVQLPTEIWMKIFSYI